ncbi:heat shock factor-binding protein 1-like [Gracilinanus agilis]|uniref:heat shock factor-binding protein 1-like n=1 Tax=Gracilinanus agilis TaxID=191870 RepID=UPI001CFF41BB|nr:heat shock factor-binding protein 1-like [Gracilinanus agilis]
MTRPAVEYRGTYPDAVSQGKKVRWSQPYKYPSSRAPVAQSGAELGRLRKKYSKEKSRARAVLETDPKTVQDLTAVVHTPLQQMQDKFQTMSDQISGRIDDMSSCIYDLEKNSAGLMTQAGVEEIEGQNKTPTTRNKDFVNHLE